MATKRNMHWLYIQMFQHSYLETDFYSHPVKVAIKKQLKKKKTVSKFC